MTSDFASTPASPARRAWLRKTARSAGAAALGGGAFMGPFAGESARAADDTLTPLKLSWNDGAICTAPVPVAVEKGFFASMGCRSNS